MSTSLLYHTQGLRDYNFKSCDFVGNEVLIAVEQKTSKLCCTACGSRDFTAVVVKERRIKGVPVGIIKSVKDVIWKQGSVKFRMIKNDKTMINIY